MAEDKHTTLVIEGADHGGYVVKGVHDRFGMGGGLLFAGSLDECLGFIRKSIRQVEAPKPAEKFDPTVPPRYFSKG